MAETADAVVVGAGVVGGSVAYHLAREGMRVCLLERESVGWGASGHGHGAVSLVGKDFRPGPHFELGVAGAKMYPGYIETLMEDGGVDPLYHELPGLSLAVIEEEERIFRDAMEWQRDSWEMRWIDFDECREMEPRLTSEGRGAVLYRHGQVCGYRLALAEAQAVERLGGRVLIREATGLVKQGHRVTGVEYRGGSISCGAVVLSMGAWTGVAREWLDFPVPVRPLHGEVLNMRLAGDPFKLFLLTGRHGPILQRRDGILLVGSVGGVTMSGMDVDAKHVFDPREGGPWEFDLEPKEANRNYMLDRALRIVPALEDAELEAHLAGVRPLSADRMPLIGPVPGLQGAYLATGHGTKGIHLAPITGRMIADYVLRGRVEPPVPAEAFLPERFAHLVVPAAGK